MRWRCWVCGEIEGRAALTQEILEWACLRCRRHADAMRMSLEDYAKLHGIPGAASWLTTNG